MDQLVLSNFMENSIVLKWVIAQMNYLLQTMSL